MKPLALALASALGALAWGCEGVPTLTFVQPDATPDATPEAAGDATEDGALTPTDAGVEGGCPSPAPAQTPFVCCGPITCEGQCAGQCDACMSKCTSPGDLCCAKNNNVVCLPAGSICR
jgi:hypothetical protein